MFAVSLFFGVSNKKGVVFFFFFFPIAMAGLREVAISPPLGVVVGHCCVEFYYLV